MLLINIEFNIIQTTNQKGTKKKDEDPFPNPSSLIISRIYIYFKKKNPRKLSFHCCFTQPNKNLVAISLELYFNLCDSSSKNINLVLYLISLNLLHACIRDGCMHDWVGINIILLVHAWVNEQTIGDILVSWHVES